MPRTLSEDEQRQFAGYLENNTDLDECLACGGDNLMIDNTVDAAPMLSDQADADLENLKPYGTVLCDDCGYAHQFNLIATGILEVEQD